jgi:hypothetical protein
VDTREFWQLIEDARRQSPDPADCDAIAGSAGTLLSSRARQEIVAAYQILGNLLSDSYRRPLWAAAYLINGGCSDDGFEYFRGWLVTQGREVFERAIIDPDALADLPAVRAAAAEGSELECEEALSIAWKAYIAATGEELPADVVTPRYPELGPPWDFDDDAEMGRQLPRLAALYLE